VFEIAIWFFLTIHDTVRDPLVEFWEWQAQKGGGVASGRASAPVPSDDNDDEDEDDDNFAELDEEVKRAMKKAKTG